MGMVIPTVEDKIPTVVISTITITKEIVVIISRLVVITQTRLISPTREAVVMWAVVLQIEVIEVELEEAVDLLIYPEITVQDVVERDTGLKTVH